MTKVLSHIAWYITYAYSLLPLRVHYIISDIVRFFMKNIFSYRKKIIYTNLQNSFPQLSGKEIKRVADDYYKYMCDVMMETIWNISASDKRVSKVIKMEGVELLDDMLAKHGKVIVVLGHRGNWEMVGAFNGVKEERKPSSFANWPMVITYKRARSAVSNFIFEKMRMEEYKKYGVKGHIVESKQMLRFIMKGTDKHTYIFIADQYPRLGGVPVKFLNQDTLFFAGAEGIAMKLNIPVIYLDMAHLSRGKYLITFSLISENPKELGKGEVTLAYARLLEKHINENKHAWLWSHKRWKRPFTPQEREECNRLCNLKEA